MNTYVTDNDSCENLNGTLTCSLGTLSNGEVTSFDITVNATQLGSVINIASVSSEVEQEEESFLEQRWKPINRVSWN